MTTLPGPIIQKKGKSPPKIIVYGLPGIGKTTFAHAAGSLIIDAENGAGAIDGVMRTPYLDSWPAIRQWLVALGTQRPDGVKAVAIDTIDWVVRRIEEHVVIDLDPKAGGAITNTLGSSHGGYFKGREVVANIVSRELLPLLNRIADNGFPVLVLAHAKNEKATSPEGFSTSHAAPDLPTYIGPVFIEWADAVLFAHRGAEGDRVMATESSSTVLAKNRYGISSLIPFTWASFVAAAKGDEKKEVVNG